MSLLLRLEKDNDTGLEVATDEGREHCLPLLIPSNTDKFLDELWRHCGRISLSFDSDGALEGQFDKIVNTGGHCGGEEHRLAVNRAILHNFFQFLSETKV